MPISFLLPWDYERGFAEYAASQERSYAEKLPGIPVWKGEDPRGKAIVIASFVGRSDSNYVCQIHSYYRRIGSGSYRGYAFKLWKAPRDGRGSHKLAVYDVGVDFETNRNQRILSDNGCPLIFKTSLDSIPAKIPYLLPDAEKVEFWKGCLNRL